MISTYHMLALPDSQRPLDGFHDRGHSYPTHHKVPPIHFILSACILDELEGKQGWAKLDRTYHGTKGEGERQQLATNPRLTRTPIPHT